MAQATCLYAHRVKLNLGCLERLLEMRRSRSPRGRSIRVYEGVVKNMDANNKFCYIECKGVMTVFGRDAYAKADGLEDLDALENGMKVRFWIRMDDETPRARDIEIVFAPGNRYDGCIKTIRDTFAFIQCPEVSDLFGGVDVFVGERHLIPGLTRGTMLAFTAVVSAIGRPQATELIAGCAPDRSDMLVRVTRNVLQRVGPCELIIVPELICQEDDRALYTALAGTIQFMPRLANTHSYGIEYQSSFHYNRVVKQLPEAFAMTLANAKIFHYSDGTQARPFHHVAHFYSRALQQRQNTSVIASFGATRMLTFKNVSTGEVRDFELKNGMALTP